MEVYWLIILKILGRSQAPVKAESGTQAKSLVLFLSSLLPSLLTKWMPVVPDLYIILLVHLSLLRISIRSTRNGFDWHLTLVRGPSL